MLRKMAAMLWLLLYFLWAVLQSGVQTLGVILARRLGGGRLPEPGIIRLPFRPMSPAGAAILSGMICLTPGTTVLDVDMARHEMLIHLLDVSGADALAAQVRRSFEPGLLVLFGEKS
ncbi:MAG: Na+/H+ antiporter subunit E [Lautropia sp.]|nr:Na+/H+ antiporter subunit E [Lautropia sp.]